MNLFGGGTRDVFKDGNAGIVFVIILLLILFCTDACK